MRTIRVSKLRVLSILLAFTAAVGLVFGTAGFTTMDADRGVDIKVAEDENAYLSYEPLVDVGKNISEEEPTEVVKYHNQFGVELDYLEIYVSATSAPGVTIQTFDAPEQLDPGSAGTVTVTLDCSTTQMVDLNFQVSGSGSGKTISLDRTLSVTCVPTPENQEDGEDEEQEDGEDEEQEMSTIDSM